MPAITSVVNSPAATLWPSFVISPEDLDLSINCAMADIQDALEAQIADARNKVADRRQALSSGAEPEQLGLCAAPPSEAGDLEAVFGDSEQLDQLFVQAEAAELDWRFLQIRLRVKAA